MRALITGINGFVGGHLAEYLLEQGSWDIWGIALEDTLRLPHLRDHVQCAQADLCNRAMVDDLLAKIRPQVIFHLAGQPFVPESFRDPSTTFHINIMAQLRLYQAMLDHQIDARVLSVTSAEVYGQIHAEDLPLNEDTPLRPLSPYAVSKVAQDLLGLQYHLSHQLDVVRVRPFNHIGPRQNDRFVASSFAQQVAAIEQGNQPPILKVGNLTAQRDFTDVRDMVRAYVMAFEAGEAGQVYNIGSGKAVSIQHLLDILLAASTRPIEVQPDPERMRPSDIPVIVCDARRFYAQTGWQQQIPFEQTMHDILNEWRTQEPTE